MAVFGWLEQPFYAMLGLAQKTKKLACFVIKPQIVTLNGRIFLTNTSP